MNHINYQLLKEVHRLKPIIKSHVAGIGTYLPKQRVTSESLMEEIGSEAKYGRPHDWMSTRMGIKERRMATMEQKPSDLAIKAARDAFERAPDCNPNHIDAVIFCGIERDMPEPATAHLIQRKLGLKAAHAFDIANACFGFFDGIKLASNLIENGVVRYALVLTGEVTTKMARAVAAQLKQGISREQAKHMWGMLSVGDAGGAMILGPSDNPDSGFVKFHQTSCSQYADLCHYNWNPDGSVDAHMNMAHIVARGLQLNKKMYHETLDQLGWSKVEWAIAHQTGRTTFEHAIDLHGIEKDKIVKTYPKLGNITTATLPMSFKTLMDSDNLMQGDRVGGLFAGSGLVAGQFGYVV